jgi:predicted hotdog family 3-hydroxylacyl-ACP dehydratase
MAFARLAEVGDVAATCASATRPNCKGRKARPRHASHVALEWIAQACAAFGGSEALDEGYAVRISFLLGTRDFRAERAWFAEAEHLYVRVRLEYRDEALATLLARWRARSPVRPWQG